MGNTTGVTGPGVFPVGDNTTQGIPTTSKSYTVQDRDTLTSIAAAHHLTVRQIIAANSDRFDASLLGKPYTGQPKHPDRILLGQVISLPIPRQQTLAPIQGTGTPVLNDVLETKTDACKDLRSSGNTTCSTSTPQLIQPEQTGVGGKAKVDGKSNTTQGTPSSKTDEVANKKVFAFLDKIFRDSRFQGLLAVLAVIPAIGQIASGIAAVLSLVNIIERWITTKHPPDLVSIGSTLLFLGGAFVPGLKGLGGIGGVVGMMRTPSQEQESTASKSQPASTSASTTNGTETASAPPMSLETFTETMATIRAGLENLGAQCDSESYASQLAALATEYAQLQECARQEHAAMDSTEKYRLAELGALFGKELLAAVTAEAERLTPKLKAADAGSVNIRSWLVNHVDAALATAHGPDADKARQVIADLQKISPEPQIMTADRSSVKESTGVGAERLPAGAL